MTTVDTATPVMKINMIIKNINIEKLNQLQRSTPFSVELFNKWKLEKLENISEVATSITASEAVTPGKEVELLITFLN